MTTHDVYIGDSLDVLRHLPDDSVQCIYADIPYNKGALLNNYFISTPDEAAVEERIADNNAAATVLRRHYDREAQDTWTWDDATHGAWIRQLTDAGYAGASAVAEAMRVSHSVGAAAFVLWVAVRAAECRRILQPDGLLCIHCDDSSEHHVRVALDLVFGAKQFLNAITWQNKGVRNTPRRFARYSDRIICYAVKYGKHNWNGSYRERQTKTTKIYWDADGRPYVVHPLGSNSTVRYDRMFEWRGSLPPPKGWALTYEGLERGYANGTIVQTPGGAVVRRTYIDSSLGSPQIDIWQDINYIDAIGKERLGYATQKPIALIERIIAAAARDDGVVLDFCAGSGTTAHAAHYLGRNSISIDINPQSWTAHKRRLNPAQMPLLDEAVLRLYTMADIGEGRP